MAAAAAEVAEQAEEGAGSDRTVAGLGNKTAKALCGQEDGVSGLCGQLSEKENNETMELQD